MGSDTEQVITTVQGSNVVLLFTDHKFHSMVNLNVNNAIKGETDDRYTVGLEKTIGTFTANIKVADEKTDLPTKLLVVLNGNPERLANLEIDLKASEQLHLYDDVTKKPLQPDEYALAYLTRRLSDEAIGGSNSSIVLFSPSGEDTEYCTMTNAVYVGDGTIEGDAVATQTGKVCNWTYITTDNIKTTEEAAAAAPLTVHVERLAVKVEIKLAERVGEELGAIDRGGFKYPVLITPAEDSKVAQIVPDEAEGTKTEQTEWAFSMLGWSTNAVARRMYLFKNLDDERVDISNAKDVTPHYSSEKKEIVTKFFSGWNDAKHARCYWAVDGHYADPKAYPVQYRVAKDNTATQSYVELTKENGTANMPLYYYSFQQLRMISMGLVPNADPANLSAETYTKYLQKGNLRSNLAYRYCGENVLGQALINDPGHIWRGASTHAIIFGQLLLGKEIEDYKTECGNQGNQLTQELLNSVSDKLYAAGSYWNRADYMKYAFTTIYKALSTTSRDVNDYFGGTGEIVTPRKAFKLYYKKADGTGEVTEIPSDYFTTLSGLNDIHDKFDYTKDDCNADDDDSACIFRLSAANVSNGDGKVMLGLKKAYKLIIKGKNEVDKDGAEDPSTFDDLEITPEKFLSLAYEFVGPADYFARGRMYYYVPIYHAATASAATGAAPEKVGDIGVVRNNWYVLTVSSLLKPGIPVSDPTQPIIPNIDPSDRYLGLDVHILPWHVVKQDITLQ